ncbi:hypothetical protein AX17_007073 [Amanita inopinata Kibby_2008]|nr:hypothetical protein AX17_007073 [Amanita inopinata Kibby_2008]
MFQLEAGVSHSPITVTGQDMDAVHRSYAWKNPALHLLDTLEGQIARFSQEKWAEPLSASSAPSTSRNATTHFSSGAGPSWRETSPRYIMSEAPEMENLGDFQDRNYAGQPMNDVQDPQPAWAYNSDVRVGHEGLTGIGIILDDDLCEASRDGDCWMQYELSELDIAPASGSLINWCSSPHYYCPTMINAGSCGGPDGPLGQKRARDGELEEFMSKGKRRRLYGT